MPREFLKQRFSVRITPPQSIPAALFGRTGDPVKPFKGTINLDIRNSKPDWSAFLADRAPKGAPNVLVVLYDDTGCAAWAPYGGRINMPTLQRLADNGLMMRPP